MSNKFSYFIDFYQQNDQVDEQCLNYSKVSKYLFSGQKNNGLLISVICLQTIVYGVPITLLWLKRNTAEMTPRSPMMTLLGMVYLLFDSLGNTWLFSMDPQTKSTMTCDLGIIITVVC